MEILQEPPKTNALIPLAEHQSVTPESFYTGPPVLYYYSDRSKLIVLEHELHNAPALRALIEKSPASLLASDGQTNGHATNVDSERTVEDIDVWVTSDKLFLYSNTASLGVSIPYPSISLHAIQSLPAPSLGEQQGLYMQLVSSTDEGGGDDQEPESISLTIIPTASAPPVPRTEHDLVEEQPEQTPVTAMFTALSSCSNLHPDPIQPGEEEDEGSRLFQAGLAIPGDSSGGLPPPMPGSGGWITAENMHEFVDDEGNWIGENEEGEEVEEPLGPGAGSVRNLTEDEENVDGQNGGSDETKWRRTS